MASVRIKLLNNLQTIRERKSYLIQVGYTSYSPAKAAALADSLVKAFLADQTGRKLVSHKTILAALRDRVDHLEALYHEKERAENDFVVSSGLDHVGEHAALIKQLEELGRDAQAAHRKVVESTNRAIMLAAVSARPGGVNNTTEATSSPLLQRLRERLVELTAGAGTLNLPAGANNTTLAALRAGIEAEALRLVQVAQNDAAVAQRSKEQLQAEIARIDARLVQWQENQRIREDMHRGVVTLVDALKVANDRYMREAGRGDILQSDVEILYDAVIPDRPSFPNPLMYAAGTLMLIVLLDGLILIPTIRRAIERAR
jgi:polysaccharide biosynthesis transport protein